MQLHDLGTGRASALLVPQVLVRWGALRVPVGSGRLHLHLEHERLHRHELLRWVTGRGPTSFSAGSILCGHVSTRGRLLVLCSDELGEIHS